MTPSPIIGWLLPPLGAASGGLNTIFSTAKSLAEAGLKSVLAPSSLLGRSRSESEGLIKKWYDFGVAVDFTDWEGCLSKADILVATIWQSADFIIRKAPSQKSVYFVQDIESLFYPYGYEALSAETTYRDFPGQFICIGHWLRNRLAEHIPAERIWPLDFNVDADTYYPPTGGCRERSVLLLYQPEKPRRCSLLGVDVLNELRRRDSSIVVHTYGSRKSPRLSYHSHHHGILSAEGCADLFRRAGVGLCFSATNPSRIPFEMAAAGLPTIELGLESNRFDHAPGSGVVLSGVTVNAIASNVLTLMNREPKVAAQVHAVSCAAGGEGRQARLAFADIYSGRGCPLPLRTPINTTDEPASVFSPCRNSEHASRLLHTAGRGFPRIAAGLRRIASFFDND